MVTQNITSSIRKNPPGPSGYPFVGALPKMLQNPLQFVTHAVREYGNVVHLGAMGRQQVYLIVNPDDVKYVLQENSPNYHKGTNFKAIKQILGESLTLTEGDIWRRQRRLMQPSFHRQRIEVMVTDMTTVIAQMLEKWHSIKRDKPLDISVEMMQLTQKIVLKALFSLDAGNKLTELIQSWDTVYEFISDRLWASFKLPLEIPTPSHRRVQKAIHTLDTYIYSMIQERRQSDRNPNDLLSMLLESRDEESGKGMSDRQLHSEIMAMFIGGFETTASVLAWTWYLLSKHPSVERQLSAEIAQVLGRRTPTLEDLPHLKYTRMVFEESLRLYPSAWIFYRTNLNADTIGDYDIPANSLILLSPFVTHRLPAFWENPEGFDPDRFAPERTEQRHRYAYYPFGGGHRQCIGEIFAMTEMQLIIAMVVQNFHLHLVPEHPVEREPKFTLRARHGMLMTLNKK